MGGFRCDTVEQEIQVEEHALRHQDNGALQPVGLGDLDGGHQMHLLVFRFVQKLENPVLIVGDAANSLEVLQQSPQCTRHSGDSFEHHGAVAVAFVEEHFGTDAHELDDAQCNTAGLITRRAILGKVEALGLSKFKHFRLLFKQKMGDSPRSARRTTPCPIGLGRWQHE